MRHRNRNGGGAGGVIVLEVCSAVEGFASLEGREANMSNQH